MKSLTLHEKINQRQRVTISRRYTVNIDGVYYTAVLGGSKIHLHKCINQSGGPIDQELVSEPTLQSLHRLRREQMLFSRLYNPQWFAPNAIWNRWKKNHQFVP